MAILLTLSEPVNSLYNDSAILSQLNEFRFTLRTRISWGNRGKKLYLCIKGYLGSEIIYLHVMKFWEKLTLLKIEISICQFGI